MPIRPVVEDVPKQIDVRFPDGLRREEVVRHELDPGGHGGGDRGRGALDHRGEVLHDEAEVGVRVGEADADVAAGAADVDDGARARFAVFVADHAGPGVALVEEGGREAEAVGEGGHGAREALRHVRVRGVVFPHGLVGALGQAPAGLVGLVAVVELLHCGDGVREGLPDFVKHVAEARGGVGVFGQLARGGRVRNVTGARLLEDAVVGDGEAEDAAKVGGGEVAFLGEVGEGDGAVDGDVRGDVVLVDCLEADAVQLE